MCTSTGSTPPCSPATRSVPQPARESTDIKLRWWAGAQFPQSDSNYPSPPMSDFSSPPGRTASGGAEDILDPISSVRSETKAATASGDDAYRQASAAFRSHHHHHPSAESIPRSEPYVHQIGPSQSAGFVGSTPVGGPPMPMRPGEKQAKPSRRSKAHVPAACGNCKKAHLACDIQRPCTRCVMTGKQATCRNVEHKKRGRPRLRDEREPKIEPPEGITAPPGLPHAPIMPAPAPDTAGSHRRMDSFRVLRSHRDRMDSVERDPITGRSIPPYSDLGGMEPRPIAFLNLNLTILRANRLFQDLFGSITDGSGPKLAEFLESRHAATLQTLETDLRQERSRRDENYLPPISGTADLEAAQRLSDSEIDRACNGFQIRSYQWSFVFPGGHSSNLQVTVRLAKTTAFFAVITLPAFPRPEPRPIMSYVPHPSPSYPSPTSMQPYSYSSHPPPGPYAAPLPPSPLSSFQALNTSLPPTSPVVYTQTMPPPPSRPLHTYSSYQSPSSQPGSTYQPSSRTPEPTVGRESLQLPPIIGQGAPQMPPLSRFAVTSGGREHVGYTYPDNEDVSDSSGSRKRRRIYE